jgi:GMP synthase (glutamine-hydrolysing)
LFDALHDAPDDRALLWELGLDRQFADEAQRRIEIGNFVATLVAPHRRAA